MSTESSTSEKRLLRSTTDRKLAGVCGGIAKYFGLDSTLIRLIWLILLLVFGSGLLLYVILWFVMPLDSEVNPKTGI